MTEFLNFLKSADFARFVLYGLTAIGLTVDPLMITQIITGTFALASFIYAVRAYLKAKPQTPAVTVTTDPRV